MVGKAMESAVPVIMFFDEEPQLRRMVQEFVKRAESWTSILAS